MKGKERTYKRHESIVFRKTKEKYGGLSNMAPGFPLYIGDISVRTSEALYQACRFPQNIEVQEMIIEQKSPMTAKMKSKPFRNKTRNDWDLVRVKIMRWCLRVKLACNWTTFGELLLSTGEKPIVEDSRRDSFWGAVDKEGGILKGHNVLGRLLMELREELRKNSQSLETVKPPDIDSFFLHGDTIPVIYAQKEVKKTIVPPKQLDLFFDS